MSSLKTAETLLTLFTTAARAAEIVGDLAEERSTRGTVWFWAAVIGTLLRFFWHDVRSSAAVLLPLVAVGVGLNFVSRAIVAPAIFQHAASSIGSGLTAWILSGIIWGRLVAPFLAALLLAKLARGHEFTIGLVFAVSGYWAQWLLTNAAPSSAAELIGLNLIPVTSILMASVLMRRFAVRQPTLSA